MKQILKAFLLIIYLFSFAHAYEVSIENKELYDATRKRLVPVTIYKGDDSDAGLVIINHGYTVQNTEYSFIANELSNSGYLVVSVQHDLKTDRALPTTGNLFKKRMPFWNRGVQNISFVLSSLNLSQEYDSIILIGHSNGGDISMMFASKYPNLVSKVISLDSLRYPFPTNKNIKILSFRANDTKADDGVLSKIGATLITLKDAKHIDMCDRGPAQVKEEIVDSILSFVTSD